ncbi:MAG TPA: thiamine pyrophosphate-dependent dehydrogenase E1 component subunit alpha [Thermoflexales bacterium]|nr:thiamine pyrophosphate-dependent dehydrogenase E1 component subunit alpha [Thermoflexales bacterium]HQY24040.1 thiamine pyrophosphate-dependent dehydrogenase E1 component subunit alpha [Thermoflexales bacterium]HQZ53070.1 thiamine pyrophosphate-dependent dehydrogenase E1 component subunit alpha [Thermoflexales bacterium]HRA52538.1 thiamine pyrophosphate-dependent dehydrogenase E1 component subunit alpha [Thermoflexales bacterium]
MDLETGAVADPPAETLAEMYAMLIRARKLDERCWILHRQGKIGFHISGMGHEAAQIGIAWAMRRGYDMLHPYYRDLAMVLACGMPLTDVLLGSFGRQGDPSSGGRQMPNHYCYKPGNVFSVSSPVGTQLPQAAGLALAEQLSGGDRVVITCVGEGSTSEGDFHEAMIWAGVRKLPLVVVVENNEYAISVPMRQQMAIERVSDRAGGYGVRGVSVDGLDMLASYRVAREAIDIARSGGGSTLLEARVVRLTPHSSDDNDTTYRSVEEKIALKAKDPLPRVRASLIARGALTEAQALDIEERALIEVDAAHRAAEAAPYPPNAWALGPVFAGSGDGHG